MRNLLFCLFAAIAYPGGYNQCIEDTTPLDEPRSLVAEGSVPGCENIQAFPLFSLLDRCGLSFAHGWDDGATFDDENVALGGFTLALENDSRQSKEITKASVGPSRDKAA